MDGLSHGIMNGIGNRISDGVGDSVCDCISDGVGGPQGRTQRVSKTILIGTCSRTLWSDCCNGKVRPAETEEDNGEGAHG